MLTQLTIQNFGLIDRLSLEFDPRLNILTGETGAGKSILIDALRIALGDRFNISQLRDPQKPCVIEAVFAVTRPELRSLDILKDFLLEQDTTDLIIQRTCSSDGRQKIKINGLTVTVGQLKDVGNHLIDFHGPHDHQMLLSSDSHRGMLDRLVDFGDLLEEYGIVYHQFRHVQKKLQELQALAESRERELDMLSFQVKELEQVPLDEARYEELLQEQVKMNNAERLHEWVAQLIQLLEGDDNGASEHIRQAFSPMRSLNHIDEKTSAFMDSLSQLQATSEHLLSDLHHYADGLNFEPQRANEINGLCDMYDNIKRKYGVRLEDVRNFYQQAKTKYDLLINFEHQDSQLRGQLEEVRKALIIR